MSDLEKAAKYPEGKAFYQSVIDYMRSADFNPSAEITVDELKKILAEKPRQVSLKELNNIKRAENQLLTVNLLTSGFPLLFFLIGSQLILRDIIQFLQ